MTTNTVNNLLSTSTPPPKRKRAVNFTAEEKSVLLNLVFQEQHIIECKKTDATTWREKEASWQRVTSSFNAKSPAQTFRSVESLKKLYENQKKQVRKDVAQEKASIRKTGGGSGYFLNDSAAELTLALMNRKTVEGLENQFDSNSTSTHEEPGTEHIYIECEESQVQEENTMQDLPDWSNYTPALLKKPVHQKLQVVNKSIQPAELQTAATPNVSHTATSSTAVPSGSQAASNSWSARRRPISSSLSSSDITKQYTELSSVKLEAAHLELQTQKATTAKKAEREEVEFQLRKRSLQLDIEIKEAVLKKIDEIPAADFIKNILAQYMGKN